jgi:hypothetical protein
VLALAIERNIYTPDTLIGAISEQELADPAVRDMAEDWVDRGVFARYSMIDGGYELGVEGVKATACYLKGRRGSWNHENSFTRNNLTHPGVGGKLLKDTFAGEDIWFMKAHRFATAETKNIVSLLCHYCVMCICLLILTAFITI